MVYFNDCPKALGRVRKCQEEWLKELEYFKTTIPEEISYQTKLLDRMNDRLAKFSMASFYHYCKKGDILPNNSITDPIISKIWWLMQSVHEPYPWNTETRVSSLARKELSALIDSWFRKYKVEAFKLPISPPQRKPSSKFYRYVYLDFLTKIKFRAPYKTPLVIPNSAKRDVLSYCFDNTVPTPDTIRWLESIGKTMEEVLVQYVNTISVLPPHMLVENCGREDFRLFIAKVGKCLPLEGKINLSAFVDTIGDRWAYGESILFKLQTKGGIKHDNLRFLATLSNIERKLSVGDVVFPKIHSMFIVSTSGLFNPKHYLKPDGSSKDLLCMFLIEKGVGKHMVLFDLKSVTLISSRLPRWDEWKVVLRKDPSDRMFKAQLLFYYEGELGGVVFSHDLAFLVQVPTD